MKRLVTFLMLNLAVILCLAQTSMVVGRVKTPLKVGVDYTMPAPATAPIYSGTDQPSGFCTNASSHSYTFKVSQVNPSGESSLSPASVVYVPTGTSKKMRVTRPTLAANATGWELYWARDDAPTTYKLCQSGTVASLAIAAGTTTFDCSCAGSTVFQGSNTTGFRRTVGIDVTPGVIDASTYAGGVQNLITEGAVQQTIGVAITAIRTVSVCASGCAYTSLGAACAANTSTAALPILFSLGPGIQTGAQACTGQSNATYRGAGKGVTVLDRTTTGAGDYGTLDISTNTNPTVADMTILGHRAIYAAFGGTGGGDVHIHDVAFETKGNDADEDCAFFSGWAAGSRFFAEHNECKTYGDGFTNKSGDAEWHMSNNTFSCGSSSAMGRCWAYSMIEIVSNFVSIGDTFNMSAARPGAVGIQVQAFQFGFPSESSGGGCASNCKATIIGAKGIIANTDGPGEFGGAEGIEVRESRLTSLEVLSSSFAVSSTDSTTALVYGINLSNSTTSVTSVFGGNWSTSGGTINQDFNAGAAGTISVYGSSYSTGTSVPGNMKAIKADFVNVGGGDLVPGTCTGTEIRYDTGGVTSELCWCVTGSSNYRCITATTINGPTD